MGRRKPDEEGPLDPRRIGRLAHCIVCDMLHAGLRAPSPSETMAFVARHPLMVSRAAVVYRQATRMRVSSAVAMYFRYFAPAEDWRFEGGELVICRCRFDLLWRTADRSFVVDELKAGRPGSVQERRGDEEQLSRYLRAGSEHWGEQFGGVRMLMLGAPRDSRHVLPDGRELELPW